jgi:ATP-dependent Clp protease ATP-binding subunit ClpC
MSTKFSDHVKETISLGREEAVRLGNDYIGTEHLLLGMIKEGNNTAVQLLKSFNVDLPELKKEVELLIKNKKITQEKGKVSKMKVKTVSVFRNSSSLTLNKQAENVIRETVLEAKASKSQTVEIDQLMLTILKSKDNLSSQILSEVRRGLQE